MNKKLWIVGIVVLIIIGLALKNNQKPTSTLIIGDVTVLSGPVAYIGVSNMKGVEIGKTQAMKEHSGLNIEVYHEDSMFTPQGGINAYTKLKQIQNINALVTMASNVSVAVAPLAIKDNVLDVAASTLATNFTTPNDLSFRLSAKADSEVLPTIQYLKNQNLTRLGIIYLNNDIGISLRDSLKKNTQGTSITVVAEEGFNGDVTDYKTHLLKLKNAGVDSIYLASIASQSNVILTQANDLGIKVVFLSYRAAEDPALLKAGKLAENVIYTNAYDSNSTSSENKEFVKMYRDKYNEIPNGYAVEAFEAVRLIADVYVKCGNTVTDVKAKDCTISYLTGIKNRPTILGPISFDINGDVIYDFFLKTVRDGQFIKLTN
jgi:branched-chain amino acid transport system substrate-binding protein